MGDAAIQIKEVITLSKKELNILGISFLSDAGASLVRGGKIISAANEERFNRAKLWFGVPRRAIRYVLEAGGITMEDVDIIALHCKCRPFVDPLPYIRKMNRILLFRGTGIKRKLYQLKVLFRRYFHETRVLARRTPSFIREIKKFGRPVRIIDHHLAHAASAYFTSGWDSCYALTIDGWGENSSNTLWKCSGGRIEFMRRSYTFDSLGYFYGSVTKTLGFKPHRHEGKILGLAAHGDPEKAYPYLSRMVGFEPRLRAFVGKMEEGIYTPHFDNPNLDEIAGSFDMKDMAAAAQKVLEDVVLEYVNDIAGEHLRLALAGGIFANVKLNQRILELDCVDEIFIHPNMGDGGLATGAALYVYSQMEELKPFRLKNVYYGCDFGNDHIKNVLEEEEVEYVFHEDIEDAVAQLLSEGKIVARFKGGMEYGPRALGNRSILYETTDPEVNNWLNKKLDRTEFMPFAPVTLEEEAGRCFKLLPGGEYPARFMTITFDCTDWMKEISPAVVHVDGTARPQIIREKDNPDYYRILKGYYKRTGIPSLINTSFNMHEEPIVCTPQDAVRAFRQSELDYLAIGDFLVKRSGNRTDK